MKNVRLAPLPTRAPTNAPSFAPTHTKKRRSLIQDHNEGDDVVEQEVTEDDEENVDKIEESGVSYSTIGGSHLSRQLSEVSTETVTVLFDVVVDLSDVGYASAAAFYEAAGQVFAHVLLSPSLISHVFFLFFFDSFFFFQVSIIKFFSYLLRNGKACGQTCNISFSFFLVAGVIV